MAPYERRRAWHLQASMNLQAAMARMENPPEEPKLQVFVNPLDWQTMLDELEAAKPPVFWKTILNAEFLEDHPVFWKTILNAEFLEDHPVSS